MSDIHESVTMVKSGIHNPAEPRHFMRVVECTNTITACLGDVEVARSNQALKVKEVGFDIYDPVIYFPRGDVNMSLLHKNDKTTHCPLKGDTEYFDFKSGDQTQENLAWSYDRTIEIAAVLQDYIGFDTRFVQVTEFTVDA